MSVITISRQLGSRGDEIASAVAEKLDYRQINKKRIREALADDGCQIPEMDGHVEKKPSQWETFSEKRRRFVHMLQAEIYDVAKKDNVMMFGRGAQHLLKGFSGVFHVRIISSFGVRRTRLMEANGYDEKEAERLLRQDEHDAAGYNQFFFGAGWDDPCLYDLVLNTRTFSVKTGTGLILAALRAPEFRHLPKEIAGRLNDLALVQKVEAALKGLIGMDMKTLNVENGLVKLSGAVNSIKDIEKCKEIISAIEGVKSIDDNLIYVMKIFRSD